MTRATAFFNATDFALKVDDWTDEELIASFHGLYAFLDREALRAYLDEIEKRMGFDRANCIHQTVG